MADGTRNQLKQAYALIQQERLDEALGILRRILGNDPDNADAWWLMANAVSDPADAADALGNVLRLQPAHAEAREAYDQLIEEYPELAPSEALEAAFDVGDFNIDDLLGQSATTRYSAASDDQAFGTAAWAVSDTATDQTNLDLDDLFGGKASIDVPITPTEEEDLSTIFGAGIGDVPQPSTDRRETPSADADDMPAGFDFGTRTDYSDVPDLAEPTTELDALFGTAPEPQHTAPVEQMPHAPVSDTDLDAMFGGEPAFVGQLDRQEEKPRGRRGRRKKDQPTTFAEAMGEEPVAAAPAAPEPKRERRAKPQRLAPEPQPTYDPYAAEKRANRRSPIWRLLSLVVVVGVIIGLVLIILSSLAPDPVTLALRSAEQSLTNGGFTGVTATREGDVFRVTVCGAAGRALQGRVYEAMESLVDHVAAAGDPIKTVQLIVTDCNDANLTLYRANAPVEAVRRYLEGGKTDVRTYRASWQ